MNFKITLAVVLSALLFSCSHKAEKREVYAPSAETKKEAQAAAELDRNIVLTVDFGKGTGDVNETAKAQLQRAIAEAKKMGEIKTVEIAAWSDAQYPEVGKTLPKDQVNLADKRAENLEKIVESIEPSSVDVKKHNMAKQPNSFQKWVNTRDAEVKEKLASVGIVSRRSDTPVYDRTSSAMVFIEVK